MEARDADFFNYVINEIRDPVYAVDPKDQFRFYYVNSAACVHFGADEAELLRTTVPDWDPLFPSATCEAAWAQIKVEKRIVIDTVHRVRSGKLVPVEVTSGYLKFQGREFIVGFIKDISERKTAEEKLARLTESLTESNRRLKQFAAIASHDLKSPLRTISILSDLVTRSSVGQLDKNIHENLAIIGQCSNRMLNLVDGLLEYATLGHTTRTFASVDVKALVDVVVTDLAEAIQTHKAKIICEILPTVVGDPLQLTRLFQNLISNSIKFRGLEPPEIHINARRKNAWWVFEVRDNGIGFDPKHAETIFESFVRLHPNERYEGNGLGLYICKTIVINHGGEIWVESQKDMGSRFYFTLPGVA